VAGPPPPAGDAGAGAGPATGSAGSARDAGAGSADAGAAPGSAGRQAADAAAGPEASPGLAAQATGSGLPGPRESCYGLPGENRLLPRTMVRYCVGAHADCKAPGAGCPLYVTLNTTGAYFGRLRDPARWGKFITVELRMTGDDPPDALAELPRVIARDFPGLDETRIYAMGASGGAYHIRRSVCLRTGDRSPLGTLSDVFAGLGFVIMCPLCDDGFAPRAGSLHVIAINGAEDTVTRGACEAELEKLASTWQCGDAGGTWCNAQADDGLVPGDGTDKVRKLTFGACRRGDLVGYTFRDEGHATVYAKNFTPPVRAYDMAWEFFRTRRKVDPGAGPGRVCR
jgi:hypothetical protein